MSTKSNRFSDTQEREKEKEKGKGKGKGKLSLPPRFSLYDESAQRFLVGANPDPNPNKHKGEEEEEEEEEKEKSSGEKGGEDQGFDIERFAFGKKGMSHKSDSHSDRDSDSNSDEDSNSLSGLMGEEKSKSKQKVTKSELDFFALDPVTGKPRFTQEENTTFIMQKDGGLQVLTDLFYATGGFGRRELDPITATNYGERKSEPTDINVTADTSVSSTLTLNKNFHTDSTAFSLHANVTSLNLNSSKFGWDRSDRWLSDAPFGMSFIRHPSLKVGWYGIGTDEFGCVRTIRLPSNHLVGAIPPSLGQLQFLQELDLSSNFLQGQLPASLRSLRLLRCLDLSRNWLTGPVPKEMGNLLKLTNLDLSANRLCGSLPDEFFKLTMLEQLRLSDNQFEGLLSENIQHLSHLQTLDLARNRFMGTFSPSFVMCFHKMLHFDLSGNGWEGPVPEEVGKLKKVSEEHWVTAELLPKEMELHTFRMTHNRLCGGIPSSIGNELTIQLTTLDLQANRLEGAIPDSLSKLRGLTHLCFSDNRLTGPIPAGISALSRLKLLSLEKNMLTGPLPFNLFSAMDELQQLLLSNNKLSGTLPIIPNGGTGPGLISLTMLDLSNNSFAGGLRMQLGKFRDQKNNNKQSQLQEEEEQQDDGNCASWVGGLKMLTSLYLHNNKLTGCLPSDLGGLTRLRELKIGGNQFRGKVPESFSMLRRLRVAEFQDNELEEFPREFTRYAVDRPVRLDLSRNYWRRPPMILVEQHLGLGQLGGLRHMLQWWDDMYDSGGAGVYSSLRVCFMGGAGAGKTSVVKRLLDRTCRLPTMRERTVALDILHPYGEREKDESNGGNRFQSGFSFWDFGGSNDYHQYNHFFPGRGSLYVLVVDLWKWANPSNPQIAKHHNVGVGNNHDGNINNYKKNQDYKNNKHHDRYWQVDRWLESILMAVPLGIGLIVVGNHNRNKHDRTKEHGGYGYEPTEVMAQVTAYITDYIHYNPNPNPNQFHNHGWVARCPVGNERPLHNYRRLELLASIVVDCSECCVGLDRLESAIKDIPNIIDNYDAYFKKARESGEILSPINRYTYLNMFPVTRLELPNSWLWALDFLDEVRARNTPLQLSLSLHSKSKGPTTSTSTSVSTSGNVNRRKYFGWEELIGLWKAHLETNKTFKTEIKYSNLKINAKRILDAVVRLMAFEGSLHLTNIGVRYSIKGPSGIMYGERNQDKDVTMDICGDISEIMEFDRIALVYDCGLVAHEGSYPARYWKEHIPGAVVDIKNKPNPHVDGYECYRGLVTKKELVGLVVYLDISWFLFLLKCLIDPTHRNERIHGDILTDYPNPMGLSFHRRHRRTFWSELGHQGRFHVSYLDFFWEGAVSEADRPIVFSILRDLKMVRTEGDRIVVMARLGDQVNLNVAKAFIIGTHEGHKGRQKVDNDDRLGFGLTQGEGVGMSAEYSAGVDGTEEQEDYDQLWMHVVLSYNHFEGWPIAFDKLLLAMATDHPQGRWNQGICVKEPQWFKYKKTSAIRTKCKVVLTASRIESLCSSGSQEHEYPVIDAYVTLPDTYVHVINNVTNESERPNNSKLSSNCCRNEVLDIYCSDFTVALLQELASHYIPLDFYSPNAPPNCYSLVRGEDILYDRMRDHILPVPSWDTLSQNLTQMITDTTTATGINRGAVATMEKLSESFITNGFLCEISPRESTRFGSVTALTTAISNHERFPDLIEYIVIGTDTGYVQLWTVQSGRFVKRFNAHNPFDMEGDGALKERVGICSIIFYEKEGGILVTNTLASVRAWSLVTVLENNSYGEKAGKCIPFLWESNVSDRCSVIKTTPSVCLDYLFVPIAELQQSPVHASLPNCNGDTSKTKMETVSKCSVLFDVWRINHRGPGFCDSGEEISKFGSFVTADINKDVPTCTESASSTSLENDFVNSSLFSFGVLLSHSTTFLPSPVFSIVIGTECGLFMEEHNNSAYTCDDNKEGDANSSITTNTHELRSPRVYLNRGCGVLSLVIAHKDGSSERGGDGPLFNYWIAAWFADGWLRIYDCTSSKFCSVKTIEIAPLHSINCYPYAHLTCLKDNDPVSVSHQTLTQNLAPISLETRLPCLSVACGFLIGGYGDTRGNKAFRELCSGDEDDYELGKVHADDRRVVTGGIKVWDVASGKEVGTYRMTTKESIYTSKVTVSPKRRSVVSLTSEGRIVVWESLSSTRLLQGWVTE